MVRDVDHQVRRTRRAASLGLGGLLVAGLASGGLALADLWTGDDVPQAATSSRPASRAQAPTAGASSTRPAERSSTTYPPLTIAVAGDTQAYGVAGRINEVGLGATGKLLARADLAIVNLETVVAADRAGLRPEPKPFTFVTGPTILHTLKAEGVDVVTAANNHTMDFGEEGMRRMLEVKASSPVPMVGLGKDDTEAWAPWTTEVKGRKVLVFGATDVLDSHLDWKAGPGKPGLAKVKDEAGFAKLVEGVKAARAADPDAVILVYLHSGIELQRCPTPRQIYTDAELAKAGASVVIGSHAHITQTTTTVGSTAVAYGMGNFVFGSGRTETRSTGVLTVTVPSRGTPTMAWDPALITGGLPRLLSGDERERALREWDSRGEGCSATGA